MRFLTVALAFILLLAGGCASLSGGSGYQVSTLIIKAPVVIPGGGARIFFQHGQARPYGGVDWYDQWCALEVRSVKEEPRTVRPGQYRVVRIQLDEMEVALGHGVQLAFAGDSHLLAGLFYASGHDSMPPPTMDVVHFYLEGPTPDVLRLTCGGALSDGRPTDGPARYRPDVMAINRILGAWARLE